MKKHMPPVGRLVMGEKEGRPGLYRPGILKTVGWWDQNGRCLMKNRSKRALGRSMKGALRKERFL